MQDKTKKKRERKAIKVQDLKPNKDVKGGVSADASINMSQSRQSPAGRHGITGPSSYRGT